MNTFSRYLSDALRDPEVWVFDDPDLDREIDGMLYDADGWFIWDEPDGFVARLCDAVERVMDERSEAGGACGQGPRSLDHGDLGGTPRRVNAVT